jgi:hypothetical protein
MEDFALKASYNSSLRPPALVLNHHNMEDFALKASYTSSLRPPALVLKYHNMEAGSLTSAALIASPVSYYCMSY